MVDPDTSSECKNENVNVAMVILEQGRGRNRNNLVCSTLALKFHGSDADHGIVQPLSLFGDSLMYGFPVNPIAQLSHDA